MLQSKPEHVAFLMHGLAVFVRFAGFKRHRLVAQNAAEVRWTGRLLRITPLKACGFQFQEEGDVSNDGAEFLWVFLARGLFAELQPKVFGSHRQVLYYDPPPPQRK